MRRSQTSRDQGASLVEFALVIPLLTLFLFGIVQFGIAYDKQQSINSAAREGARLGALPVTTVTEIQTRAREAYSASAAPGVDPAITVYGGINPDPGPPSKPGSTTPITSGVGPCGITTGAAETPVYDYVQVDVVTPYDITIPFFGVMTVDIDSEAQFRCE